MGTYIYGYSQLGVFKKFDSTFKIFETNLFIFSNFGQLKFVVFKFVGTQIKINMWVLKSVDLMKYQIL